MTPLDYEKSVFQAYDLCLNCEIDKMTELILNYPGGVNKFTDDLTNDPDISISSKYKILSSYLKNVGNNK